AHSPNLLGVALEESIEETFAELVADPVFEVTRISHRHEARFQPRQNAKGGLEQAELQQGLEWAEGIGEKLSSVKNARAARSIEHVLRQNLSPKIVHLFRLREKAMTADVEMKTFVSGGAGNSSDVNRVGFE